MQHPHARALILFSMVLLAVAVAPTVLGDALALMGMDARVARMAGSRLAVMAALSGAGMLLVGISLWEGRSPRANQSGTCAVSSTWACRRLP